MLVWPPTPRLPSPSRSWRHALAALRSIRSSPNTGSESAEGGIATFVLVHVSDLFDSQCLDRPTELQGEQRVLECYSRMRMDCEGTGEGPAVVGEMERVRVWGS